MDLSNENILHIKKEEIQYLQFKKLLNYPEIKYAYVVGLESNFKIYSNPSEEEIFKNEKSKNNYKTICKELNLNYNNIVNTKQNHTDNIQIVNGKINKDNPDLKRISEKTVNKMVEKYECNPKDIICCMSPSIRKDHFEVDEDVYKLFFEEFKNLPYLENIFEQKNNKWHIDTIQINREILKKQGLKEENIIDSGICSVCNKDLIHSDRAHGKNVGRATQIIAIT